MKKISILAVVLACVFGAAQAKVTLPSVLGVLLVCLVLPAVFSFLIDLGLRKIGWVKDGDMKLDL